MGRTNVLIYFTHKESLGHSTRTLSIIHALIKQYGHKIKISVFQAGKEQAYLNIPKQVDWFNLPNPFYSKLNFRRGISQVFSPLYAKARAQYMLSKIIRIKPDIFITEFFPFGREDCRFELLPILTYLKKNNVRILASIGYPYIVRGNIDILAGHCGLYDKFLIHTPKDLEFNYLKEDIGNHLLKAVYQRTFNQIKDRIDYTGYIMPFNSINIRNKNAIRKELGIEGKKMVIVSRGGGVRYPKIISHTIASLQYLNAHDYVFVVSAGPATTSREMRLFKSLKKNFPGRSLRLLRYIADFPSYVNAADVSLSMAGYNTSVPLLYFRKRSVLIPSREDPETALGYCCEQISRARLMRDYIGSEILDYHEATPKKIASHIEKASRKKIPIKSRFMEESWFTGAENTAKSILNA